MKSLLKYSAHIFAFSRGEGVLLQGWVCPLESLSIKLFVCCFKTSKRFNGHIFIENEFSLFIPFSLLSFCCHVNKHQIVKKNEYQNCCRRCCCCCHHAQNFDVSFLITYNFKKIKCVPTATQFKGLYLIVYH